MIPIALLSTPLLLSNFVFAQESCGKILCNPIKSNSFTELLVSVLDGVTLVLIPIITFAIVWIGFKMVLAGANKPDDFVKLKQSFFWALVGLFFVLAAKGILIVIQNTVDEIIADPEEAVTSITSSRSVV